MKFQKRMIRYTFLLAPLERLIYAASVLIPWLEPLAARLEIKQAKYALYQNDYTEALRKIREACFNTSVVSALYEKAESVRADIVSHIDDQKLLAEEANAHPCYSKVERRKVAIKKLTDQKLLAKIVIDPKDDEELKEVAAMTLTDHVLLANTAIEAGVGNDWHLDVSKGLNAVRYLNDQTLLKKVASEAENLMIANIARKKIEQLGTKI